MNPVQKYLSPKILVVVICLLLVTTSLLFVYFSKHPDTFKKGNIKESAQPTTTPFPEPTFGVSGVVLSLEKDKLILKQDSGKTFQITLKKEVKINQYQSGDLTKQTKLLSSTGDFTKIKSGDHLYVLTNLDLAKTTTIGSDNVIIIHWYMSK